MKLLVTLRCE